MNLLKDLTELLKAGVISKDTADGIEDYYINKKSQANNRLFVIFGVLGAILIGLGIILIIAHNWDELSKTTKTVLAFLPLIIGQIICGYVLLKKKDSLTWRESGTAFLFFTVGACISLISQIYNIPGDLGDFLFTWMLLCLPLVYVMRSSIASLLYIIGITWYGSVTGYGSTLAESYWYWGLLAIIMPYYYYLYKTEPKSNAMIFHNWLIPLSIAIVLGTLTKDSEELITLAYCSLFGLYILLGNTNFFKGQKAGRNGYDIIGSLGTIGLLLILSFDWFWIDLKEIDYNFREIISSPELIISLIISIVAAVLLLSQLKNKPLKDINPLATVFILFIVTFIIGLFSSVSIVLINLIVLAIGILTIISGAKKDHLGLLNFGLLIITALVICRFFDTNLSFILRGILFICVGAGFFAANYWMLQKRKKDEL